MLLQRFSQIQLRYVAHIADFQGDCIVWLDLYPINGATTSSYATYDLLFFLLKVADFTIQAIVLAALRNAFPEDRFIAEETSTQLLASGDATVEAVVAAASVAALPSAASGRSGGGLGSAADVCQALDLGGSGVADGWSARSRTWVLDPIDGTKGIM